MVGVRATTTGVAQTQWSCTQRAGVRNTDGSCRPHTVSSWLAGLGPLPEAWVRGLGPIPGSEAWRYMRLLKALPMECVCICL